MSRLIALIPAAGVGSRFLADVPKQYVKVLGKCVLQHTVDLFLAEKNIDAVILVVSPQDTMIDLVYPSNMLPEKLRILRCGGQQRSDSVYNGLNEAMNSKAIDAKDWVLVHDAARCCLPVSSLHRLIDTVLTHDQGGLLALPIVDTLKRSSTDGKVAETIPRDHLWQAQTPQMFPAGLLSEALSNSLGTTCTDEASAMENMGVAPLLVQGDVRNIKLTQGQDMALVTLLLKQNIGVDKWQSE